MKLKQFLHENNYTQNKFIEAVQWETGHRFSQGGLAKYIIGVRIPRKKEMRVIHNFTKGEVSPNDFYL